MNALFRFLASLLLLPAFAVPAAPGAHGPNGEHLDGPAAGAAAATDGRPRMEAFSELFELVARLEEAALVVMVNEYATNAPVDDAVMEMETDGLRVAARFDPATGEYRFTDAALLEALRQPGTHPMAFDITAGEAFDIVTGTLEVDDHHHARVADRATWAWIAAAVLVVLSAAVLVLRRRARTTGARA